MQRVAAAFQFGLAHGPVGLQHQGIGVEPGFGVAGGARAGADLDLYAVKKIRLFDERQGTFDDFLNAGGFVPVADQEGEFVSAGTSDVGFEVGDGAQAFADLPEQVVAQEVAERVVDFLETVQVHDEYRDVPAGGGGFFDGLGNVIGQHGTVV